MSYEEVLSHHNPKQKHAMFRFMASWCQHKFSLQLQMQFILAPFPKPAAPRPGNFSCSTASIPALAPTRLTGLTLTSLKYTFLTLKKIQYG